MSRIPKALGWLIATFIAASAYFWIEEEFVRWGSWQLTLLHTLGGLISALLAACGCVLIGAGWPVRSGSGQHCAACGHAWVPEDHILFNHCQECGAPWRWFDGRVVGEVRKNPGMLATGAVLLALPLAAVLAESLDLALWTPARPRWAMLKSVQTARPSDAVDDWRAIRYQARGDPAAERELALAIIERRAAHRAMPPEFTNWMHTRVQTGSLPASVADRWFNEMFEMRVEAPAIIEAGKSFNVIAVGRLTGGWEGVADVPEVWVGGMRIGEDPRQQMRGRFAIPEDELHGWRTLASGQVEAPTKPGPLTLTFRAWLIIGPPTMRTEFGPDDAPIAPGSQICREFRWSRTLEVLPPPPPGEQLTSR